jgi:hypothetical protein
MFYKQNANPAPLAKLLIQRLQEEDNLNAFSYYATDICSKRMTDFHLGAAEITAPEYS